MNFEERTEKTWEAFYDNVTDFSYEIQDDLTKIINILAEDTEVTMEIDEQDSTSKIVIFKKEDILVKYNTRSKLYFIETTDTLTTDIEGVLEELRKLVKREDYLFKITCTCGQEIKLSRALKKTKYEEDSHYSDEGGWYLSEDALKIKVRGEHDEVFIYCENCGRYGSMFT